MAKMSTANIGSDNKKSRLQFIDINDLKTKYVPPSTIK